MKFKYFNFIALSLLIVVLLSGFHNEKRVITRSIISEKEFNLCFPLRNKFYSYAAFTSAVNEMAAVKIKIEKRGDWIYKINRTNKNTGKITVVRQDKDWDENWAKQKPYQSAEIDYADFCTSKKEFSAIFAHMAHETRNGTNNKYNDGLMLIQELVTDSAYISQNVIYPAVNGKKYYGRGPLQLSYNGNYGFASDCIFGDKNILLNNPDLVSLNAKIAFETAIYFWMTPQSLKPSAHDVITGKWKPTAAENQKGYKPGFGMTINIINGKLECNKGENIPAMKDRIGFYQHFLKLFKTNDINGMCSCAQMTPFSD
ncbi:chitinase [Pedobacter punctiformis]|uniref:Chitinase n=1 Tax=Pedobacter punctiformis TaxID=3004097 RepID=A0ABT4L9E1_9SPHI|nr:chitinase [Pedobacter sp. HCMS5-2]MCZ4244523.1 chitinase [Pedobacter sp. HCMS5-2]